jgi:hypothetical protein
MTWTHIFKTSLAVIGSLGGGALLVACFSAWLGKVWAGRILEADKAKYAKALEDLKNDFVRYADRHRASLRKSEFIFQKEFEAAPEFVAVARAPYPQPLHPEEEWDEALERIALNLGKHEATLIAFVGKYGAVLSEEANGKLNTCLARASDGKFEVDDDGEPTSRGRDYADQFFYALSAAEKAIIATFRAQATS